MPIVWKVAFEEPLIKQIQAGTIGNSKQLVRAIVTQYDLCIKQGLAGGPAVAAGPFIAGKPFLLEKSLSNFYKIKAAKDKVLLAVIYLKLLKDIYSRIKDTSKNISLIRTQLSENISKQKQLRSQMQQLAKRKDVNSKRQLANLKTKSNGLKATQLELTSKLDVLKTEVKEVINPKIQAVKSQLRDSTKKILFPQLQDTKLKTFKKLPKRIKELISEFRNKQREIQGEIKKNISIINSASKTLKGLNGALTPEQAATVKNSINTIIKSTSIQSSIQASKKITSIIDSQPNDKISPETKNKCRNSISKIIEVKSDIQNKKEELKTELLSKLAERRKQLIGTFKPNFTPGPTKIQEILKDRKQLKNIVNDVRTATKQLTQSAKILNSSKQEYSKITASLSAGKTKYTSNIGLAESLNKTKPGMGDRYKEVKTVKEAKTFILVLLVQLVAENKFLNEKLIKIKTQYFRDYKNLILKKKFNPEERVFNIFLRIGLLAYWSGGVWGIGTVANVIFPGTITLPVQMKSTANPANFIRSLSKTFQLHLKTVNGIITFPGTPPVVSPWATYF